MRRHIRIIYMSLALLLVATSCSITKSIPEDEVLYRGISKLNYNKPIAAKEKGQEGVITALADAYNTVEGLLSGDASVLHGDEQTEQERRDSIKQANRQDAETSELAQEEVEAVLSYAPNGSLMGSSFHTHPFPIRLCIYNRYAGSKHKFGKWMFNHFAATPVYMSTVNPRVRSIVAQNKLKEYGYFHNKVSFDTIHLKDPRMAKVTYHVQQGDLFHLDSIAYTHFRGRADSIIKATQRHSLLKRGQPFSAANLMAERNRLTTALRDNGYYFHRPDYITFRADTLQVPGRVQLQVAPSAMAPMEAAHPYHIGTTRVNLYKYNQLELTDSMTRRSFTFAYSGGEKKPPLRLGAFMRYIYHRRGNLYTQTDEELTQQKLLGMGIFSSVRINYLERDTTWRNDTLDVVISAMLDKPYDLEFKGNVTSKSNGQIGPGASFSMKKHNAFRGAETLGLEAWASYEWQTGADVKGASSLLNSYEYGLTGSLSYPRLMPFRLMRHLNRRTNASTNFNINARWMNRANYYGRVSMGGSINYVINKGTNVRHEFIPLSLNYEQLLSSTARFDSIVNANQALYVSMRDQFIPAMEYNYSWVSTRHMPRTFKFSVKEAGNLTSGIFAMTGESFNKENKSLFHVPFAQFVKTTAQYTHLFKLTRHSAIATRVFAGAVYSFGNARTAPYTELFSVGGANSIRAFSIRSIGPGSYHPKNSGFSYIDQMGDLKFEANAEYRFPIVSKLYGAAFIDAGNVWLLRSNENQPGGQLRLDRLGKDIALGTGAGLRYDLDFLVLRVDVGVGIHAPYDTGKSGYYNMTRFSKSLGYHLAIGYPF